MPSLGIVGGRGFVGKELITLLEKHGELSIGLMVSARDNVTADDVAAKKLDAYVLALPNGASDGYVSAITKTRPDAVIVDLSADHRFDDAWAYGQPERCRAKVKEAKHIANPGCYATAMQLALAPLVSLFSSPPSVFGVSGYSGAGTTPSPRNDPDKLRDNLMPYSLVGHLHEREVSRTLGCPLFFMPHVAPFFRGLTVTASMAFGTAHTKDALWARYEEAYAKEPLVRLSKEAPLVRDIMEKHHVEIGGLTVSEDGKHAVIVATVDNLLGGAATPALRNLNLALGIAELTGIPDAASR